MNTVKNFTLSVLAGICISIGGCVFLSLDNKVMGALFFTAGLFTICSFGFNLFTGKVCYVFENDGKYAVNIILIWLGNLMGTWLSAMLFGATRIAGMSEKAQAMCQVKLDDSLLSIFILAIFCNILIFIAVDGYRNIPYEAGKYLALFLA